MRLEQKKYYRGSEARLDTALVPDGTQLVCHGNSAPKCDNACKSSIVVCSLDRNDLGETILKIVISHVFCCTREHKM